MDSLMYSLMYSLRPARRFLPAISVALLLGACAATSPNDGNADVALIAVPQAAKLTLTIDKHPDATSSLERALMYSGDVAKGAPDHGRTQEGGHGHEQAAVR